MNIEIVLVVLTILVMISTAVTSYFRKKEFTLKDEQTTTEFEKEMNEKKNFYKDLLLDIIEETVQATNQTLVENFKRDEDGKLSQEDAHKAFEETYANVKKLLTNEAEAMLNEVIRDVPAFIRLAIEASVNRNK